MTTYIYFKELSLQAGLELLEADKGKHVKFQGVLLTVQSFWRSQSKRLECSLCSCKADRWVITSTRNDANANVSFSLHPYAGHRPLNQDHIIPVSLGGNSEAGNLRVTCQLCNVSRGNDISEDLPLIRQKMRHLNVELFYQRYKKTLKHVKAHKVKEKRDEHLRPFRLMMELVMEQEKEIA